MAKRLVACLITIFLLLLTCAATFAQNDGPPPVGAAVGEDMDLPPAPPAFDTGDADNTTPDDLDLPPPVVTPPDDSFPAAIQPDDTAPIVGGPGTELPGTELLDSSTVSADKNWTMFRRTPTHSGTSLESLEFPLKLMWKQSVKLTLAEARRNTNNPTSPSVADGIAYFSAGSRILAVNTDTGSLRWVYPAEGTLNSGIKSSPLIGKDLVYIGSGDGRLYAITKDTGKLAWSFTTKGTMNSSPVLAEDTIFVGSSDDNLYALDPVTGQQKWRGGFKTHDDISGSPAISNGLVYFLSNDMVLYCAYTTNGRLKWSTKVGSAARSSTPVIAGNNLFVGVGNTLQCFQSQSGRLIWSAPMPEEISSIPAVSDKAIYIACRKKLYSLTLAGKSRWKTPVDLSSICYGSPTITGDNVVVGTNKGSIIAVNKETGSIKWKYILTPATIDGGRLPYTGIGSTPVVSNGNLYIVSDDGTLSAFSSRMPDRTPPYVTAVSPARDFLMPGTPPVEIAAIVKEPGSGLNADSIQLLLDGAPVKHNYISESGIVWFRTVKTQPIRPLADGRHTVTLIASDWAGNKLRSDWSFTVDNSLRVAPDASKIKQPTQPGAGGMPGMGGRGGMGGGMPGMGGMGGGGMTMPGMGGMGR